MDKIRRIYIEKKSHANVLAESIFSDITNNLQIESLKGIRVFNCYDIKGVTDETFEKSLKIVFMEPPLDIYHKELSFSEEETAFCVQYLPGQYDQRADSAMLAIRAIGEPFEEPLVQSSKIYILKGSLSKDEVSRIKSYIINPVDSHEISLEKPLSLEPSVSIPEEVETLGGFIALSEEGLSALRKKLSLAMSLEDLKECHNYFKDIEKRDPTITEIRVLDTYWSDHCRHTTFLTKIENIEFEDGSLIKPIKEAYNDYIEIREELLKGRSDKYVCLMDLAQIGMRALKAKGFLADLDESEEINACSIKAKINVSGQEEDWLVMFKNETHNHPTEIEPFGGAATCLGGAIRDPLSGRSYVYQAMRVTGSGDPRTPVSETIEGKLSQRKITTGAAQGYSSYGNQIGLATGHVAEIYHEGYVAKRMEIGAVVGAAKAENVIRKRPEESDIVILLGGRTGRDGCGGATGSSKEHTEDSILTSGAEVQKGNAPTERKLQRLFRNPEASRLIKRCNDFGAGGVSVAIGELAEGLEIDLDKVPKKYEGLDGTELAISESQERMAVVIAKEDKEKFISLAEEENLEAVEVARVTGKRRLIMRWNDKNIVDISRDFLDTNGAEQRTNVTVTEPEKIKYAMPSGNNISEKWLNNLSDLNVCAQKGLVERFDSTIGSGTVLMPFGGKKQLTPAIAMAAKLPLTAGETNSATVMSYGFDPYVSEQSPFHGALYAVIDSVSKLVASGVEPKGIRLTFQEYFEKLRDEPERWGKPFSALLGAFKAQMGLKAPSIGGKDSMSGSFNDLDVPPTLVSFAIKVSDSEDIISPEFKQSGSNIAVIKTEFDAYGMPDFDKINALNELIHSLIVKKQILSAHNIGIGGIAGAISKMAFGNELGFEINCQEEMLFTPLYGGYIIETALSEEKLKELFNCFNFSIIGQTKSDSSFNVNGTMIDHNKALESWLMPLENVFETRYLNKTDKNIPELKLYEEKNKKKSAFSIAKPRVLIPVFSGTNCEYDTKKAFELAGANASTFIIKDLSKEALQESILSISREIRNSQIIAMPGGFSAGDEPEGSGKFIAAVFKSPEIKDAIHELLNERDGLIIGICNGFQALIKLGLLPYGEIREQDEDSPTLTFNEINRHISCIVKTKIISNKSPWLYNVNPGDIFSVAVSHGEGRFIAKENALKSLIENNQIATQYVDDCGKGSYDIKFNPNGSTMAIEGITSKDGRIFGKMGHTERIGKNVYKNVHGSYDMKVFQAGVNYFK
jgi:phosphoribosylformylglycinamidine synthase